MIKASPASKKTPLLSGFALEAAIACCLLLLYGPLLYHWIWDGWINKDISIQHEYFSHGVLGLPLAASLVWEKRSVWRRLPDTSAWLGLVSLGLAIGFYASGVMDAVNLSLPLMLIGLCLCLKGTAGLRLMGFPLALVVFATPTQFPYLIEPYILPLQRMIATVAGAILHGLGFDVEVNQIYLTMNQQLVEVAPHCAGLKLLFTSLYMGMILVYWTKLYRSRLQTTLFAIAIVVVSVIGNILRNTILTFFHGSSMTGAFHWLHESWGGDLYSAAMLGSLFLLINLIQARVPQNLQRASAQARGNAVRRSMDF